ncbi:MAG: nitroreductase family protein [Desulfovibrio sp.]|uniref:nitroreductase family protein n=1 Tax=Desulfovibrio sp. 7SRBS1 TaxID=3378064 RepID=UPI003B3DFA47
MEYAEVARKRRAVNFFDPSKSVSEELLREVVELAALAPSGFNLQPWNIMVLRDQEEKMRLRKLAWDQPKITDAPVVCIILGDMAGWREGNPGLERNISEMMASEGMKPEQREGLLGTLTALYGPNEKTELAFAVKNASFFGMSLMYSAVNHGLDCHPMDGFDHDGVKKAFNIPANYWVPMILAIGHFDTSKELLPPKWRKTYDDMVVKF